MIGMKKKYLYDPRCLELAKVLIGDLNATNDELEELAETFGRAADDYAAEKRRDTEPQEGPRANLRTPWAAPQ